MSSILDALRELEAAKKKGSPAPDDTPKPSAARLGLFAAAAAAAVGGAVLAVLVVRSALDRETPPTETAAVESPAPAAAPTPAAAPEAPPPPAPPVDVTAGLSQAEPPRARVAAPKTPVRATGTLAAATPYADVKPARRPTASDDMNEAPAATVEQARRPGEPRVRVTDLHYSDDPSSRRVTVGIAGMAPVTLGEGDAIEGVEVSLILPDRAYFRHAGNIFAARPTR